MKKKSMYSALLSGIIVLTTAQLYAQTAASATWGLVSEATRTPTTTGNITAQVQSPTGMAVSAYINGEKGQRLSDTYANWPAETGPQAGRHIDYILAPNSSDEMLITSLSIGMAFNSSSACKVNISWSIDGVDFNNIVTDYAIASYGTNNSTVNYSFNDLNLFTPAGKSLTIRISPWVTSVQADKFFVSKNVIISGFTGAEGTLPLNFTSFDAELNPTGNQTNLSWTTANEVNTRTFEIERANDSGAFYTIGNIPAKNTPGAHSYTFADNHPLAGMNYYRIRQLDIDGKFTYSDVKSINNKLGVQAISLYPNPALQNVTVAYPETSANGEIKIMNTQGKLLSSQLVLTGSTSASTDVSALAPGVYILFFKAGGKSGCSTFVKQ
ncbi:T9SS type A sorting domain-containing protein [Pedobacter sp. BS3]|uniref:T9SS type A sorting domain-containing protein n=1 Tax=Pedobacter sp. BS3 TaxID=2567937 RepID=UPI0011F064B4|nr:T9SS type A sorting domain-containing protein [Pedobacter sp. BS3]TZF83640.1 T9SS type A sorting domain-containing protein [Pedobacter sp. BS3]